MRQAAATIIGWGIAIYAVTYLVWTGLVIYGLDAGYGSLVIRIATLAFVSAIAVRAVHVMTTYDLIPYSIGWVMVAILGDAIFVVPFSGWALYTGWSVWLGYTLVGALPFVFASGDAWIRGVSTR